MSVDWRTIAREVKRDAALDYEIHGATPLQPETLAWMDAHGKRYRPETLDRFKVNEGWLTCYRCAMKKKRSIWTSRVITIPAGPVTRCYRFEEAKAERWRVVPSGYPPQWIGDISGQDVLLCEGEWDMLTAFDNGFAHAATHTAGAGTWLPTWTPLFTGKNVTICYDRDHMGMVGAAKVARALAAVASNVRIVDLPLPGTPDAKDLSDFFRLGATSDDFRRLLNGARSYGYRLRSPGRGHHLPARRLDAAGLWR
jgi:hypothetical protein